jgi:hypothetical protein
MRNNLATIELVENPCRFRELLDNPRVDINRAEEIVDGVLLMNYGIL